MHLCRLIVIVCRNACCNADIMNINMKTIFTVATRLLKIIKFACTVSATVAATGCSDDGPCDGRLIVRLQSKRMTPAGH